MTLAKMMTSSVRACLLYTSQVFDGMEVQDRRGVVDSLQKYFRKLQNDIQREISPQERKQPEQNRPCLLYTSISSRSTNSRN